MSMQRVENDGAEQALLRVQRAASDARALRDRRDVRQGTAKQWMLPRARAMISRRATVSAAWLALSACAVEPASPPPPLVVGDPTDSWFAIERLPGDDDTWTCVGIVDLDRDRTDEIVLVSGTRIRVTDAVARRDTDLPRALGRWPLGCDAADLDGDGDLDLVLAEGHGGLVARFEPGGWAFSELPALPDEIGTANAFAVALFDADGDGVQDAYVARSVDGAASAFVFDGCRSFSDGDFVCGAPDRAYLGAPNVVLRGIGDGGFEVRAGTGAEGSGESQAVGVIDVDGDGVQDLVVANDAMEDRVYLTRREFVFEDATARLGIARRNHGMSVLAGDLDGDGALDLAFSDIGQPLVLRRTGGVFHALTAGSGIGPIAMWAWGAAMEDLDGDGDLDLLFENRGADLDVLQENCIEPCAFDALPREELVSFRNDGTARFTAEGPARVSGSPFGVRGDAFFGGFVLASGDFDRDGVIDAVIVRTGETIDVHGSAREAWLLRGRSAVGRGLSIEAPQGAVVEACVGARCVRREVQGAHGFGAIQARRLFFGIGGADEATVSVTWRGSRLDLGLVAAGALVAVDESSFGR